MSQLLGTTAERGVTSLVGGSFLVRVAVALIVGVCIGALLDLVMVADASIDAILGGLGGMAGGGGAILGALWGWLLGQIVEGATSQTASEEPRLLYLGKAAAWGVSLALGWLTGRFARFLFDKLTPGHWLYNAIAKLCIVILLAAATVAIAAVVQAIAPRWPSAFRPTPAAQSIRFSLYMLAYVVLAAGPLYLYADWRGARRLVERQRMPRPVTFRADYSTVVDPYLLAHAPVQPLYEYPQIPDPPTFAQVVRAHCDRTIVAVWVVSAALLVGVALEALYARTGSGAVLGFVICSLMAIGSWLPLAISGYATLSDTARSSLHMLKDMMAK